MTVDALILAGGRSSRLGGSAKQELRVEGSTLLERTIAAARAVGARHVVVVGDDAPPGVVRVREEPAFGGPVAGIAAGLRELPADADSVLVLACDMPGIARALPALVASAGAGDGAIAVDRGRVQQLAFAVAPAALARALEALPALVDAPARALLAGLDLAAVEVAEGATDDIDTWDDAALLGAVAPHPDGKTR